jgi:uncharacterized protein YutE (UPF0331/DUF86 family)
LTDPDLVTKKLALIELLARHGRLSEPLAAQLRDMAGFRNVLVHGNAGVDPGIVSDVVENYSATCSPS